MNVKYLDCDLIYGVQRKPVGYRRCSAIGELLAEIQRAGLSGGLVRCTDSETVGIPYGNARMAKDLKLARAQTGLELWGAWALLPPATRETPPAHELPALMRENQIAAIYFNPKLGQYFGKPNVIGDYCAMAEERRIPVLLDSDFGFDAGQMDELLSAFPKLVCRVSINGHWPKGRQLYPLIDRYENTYIDLAYRWEDQGVEDMVRRFGAKRVLMGSAFPKHYIGGALAQVRAAEISPEDQELIFGGNLIRMIGEADYA